MTFEWDEDKNKINLEKHGIDFETAILVFNDMQRIEIFDLEHSVEEDRNGKRCSVCGLYRTKRQHSSDISQIGNEDREEHLL